MIIINYIEIIIGILIGVALLTLSERKILGSIQNRKGPTEIGLGWLQPIIDGYKLLRKENIKPIKLYKNFKWGPIISILCSLTIWWFLPMTKKIIIIESDLGIIIVLTISSINIYGVLISGIYSNNKYSLIGSLRSISQLLFYEINIGLLILNIVLINESLNFIEIIYNQIGISNIKIMPYLIILNIICILGECSRPPMDMVEAESELTAGYFVEYSGIGFAAFYIAEYNMMIILSVFTNILWLGESANNIYNLIIIYCYILSRGILPRIKYSHLIEFGWKTLLPINISNLLWTILNI